jgi:hypothetical protein
MADFFVKTFFSDRELVWFLNSPRTPLNLVYLQQTRVLRLVKKRAFRTAAKHKPSFTNANQQASCKRAAGNQQTNSN